uniref:Secreted protein n=1 Tax=Anguilla anguilla TaxID=7936 RepID=A0A0E9SS84_ANGAN
MSDNGVCSLTGALLVLFCTCNTKFSLVNPSYAGSTPSTLKVYVVAVSSRHTSLDGQTVGSHYLISEFMRGVRCLCP